MVEVGRPGGITDAKDDNQTHTAGSFFVGQFLDHDITSDAGSTLGVPKPGTSSQNLRSARFDLDSSYGGGSEVSIEATQSRSAQLEA